MALDKAEAALPAAKGGVEIAPGEGRKAIPVIQVIKACPAGRAVSKKNTRHAPNDPLSPRDSKKLRN